MCNADTFDAGKIFFKQYAVKTGLINHFRNPAGLVMDRPAYPRNYGQNPYVGYDGRARPYPFFNGENPPHDIPALARVVRVGRFRMDQIEPILREHHGPKGWSGGPDGE